MLSRSTTGPGRGRRRGRPAPGRRWIDRPAAVAVVLGVAGFGYRLVLLLATVPGSNSDEATFGLVAMHIAEGRHFPIFLYGQRYMGTVESYLAAPLFAVAGAGWVTLRLPLLVLWAAFVVLTYRLTRRAFSPWLATFTVGLLALGSERVIRDQLTAVGGRPEVKPAIILLLLAALGLGERRIRHRSLTYAVFGLVTGLVLWDDWLAVPYLTVAVLALLVAAGREVVGRAGVLLTGGFLVGLLPLLADNLRAPPGHDSWSVFRELSNGVSAPATLGQRLHGTVEVGIPLATGLCPPDRCVPTQVWWGLAYPVLLGAATVLALVDLRRSRTGRVVTAVRLALVCGAALTLVGYVRNDLAGTAPVATARYLSMLQISLPVVLWPLWRATARLAPIDLPGQRPDRAAGPRAGPRAAGAREAGARGPGARGAGQGGTGQDGTGTRSARPRFGALLAGLPAAALAALVVGMLWGSVDLVRRADPMRAEEGEARALAAAIDRAGIRHVYAEYWTCNRLVFNTRERVVCAVLGPDLRPGQDRYGAYRARVAAAADPAYVFVADGPADRAFRDRLRRRQTIPAVSAIGSYRIYRPTAGVRPWR
ncbi:hypothetical protein [Plantactinospora sp. GCM10030261]|uniref:hypothetical protein n=1 Tax=Plantactinospora sp. GCM10030261 TaxID=3273420 RepID=UPI0036192C1B